MFYLVFAMLLVYLELEHSFCCKRENGTCCYLYVWDPEQGECLPCTIGYYGENCALTCAFPYYGHGCFSKCNCIANDSDYINGCKQSTTSTSTGVWSFVESHLSVRHTIWFHNLRWRHDLLPFDISQGLYRNVIRELYLTIIILVVTLSNKLNCLFPLHRRCF